MTISHELILVVDEQTKLSGSVTADSVLTAARDRNRYPSLHEHFYSKTDAELAHQARLQMAHQLLISLRVEIGEAPDPVRYMVSVPGTKGYVALPQVAKTYSMVEMKLTELHDDIERLRRKLETFTNIIHDRSIVERIDKLLREAASITTALPKAPPRRKSAPREGDDAR